MKVYVVIEDNGEDWEDYREWISKIFETKKQAKEYIKINKKYRKYDFRIEEHELVKGE